MRKPGARTQGLNRGQRRRSINVDDVVSSDYVDHCGEFYRVAGTRVSLDSIVYAFLSGQSAESIAQSFPVLTLEQVYGSIAFYLRHRKEVDRYLEAQERAYDAVRPGARAADPMFYMKLADAKRSRLSGDASPKAEQ
jgi:uncharacterized protein (DUF433 family)